MTPQYLHKRRTLADLIDRYIDKHENRKIKNFSNTRFHLLRWKSALGHIKLAELQPSDIAEERDNLLSENTRNKTKRSNATVVRYLASLSHAFNTAKNEWGWLNENPVAKVKKPKQSNGRVRFLSNEELTRLLQACKESESKLLYPVVVIAISTGMRAGNIMNLRWRDIDTERGIIRLEKTKNGESNCIPLTGLASKLILGLKGSEHIAEGFVFPSRLPDKPISIRKAWYNALARAKIRNFRFHDLRHCTASYLAMNGASLIEIAAVLGHKTIQMAKRYSHLSTPHTFNVVNNMTAKIFAGVENE
jgi:integrase